jgi:hypothetical protein
MSTTEEFLQHHGVKGMKWGIRNKRTSKKGASSDKPRARDLSDEELRKAVSRMQMEVQYNKLVGSKSPRHSRAVKAGGAFIAGIALNVARTQIQSQASQAVASAMAKKAAKKAAGG